MTDTIIQERAQRLVDEYADLILRLSYTYLKNTYDAQDLCQTVLLRLMTLNAPESPAHERAFVIRTTANACKDVLKSAWRRRIRPIEEGEQIPAPEPVQDTTLSAVQSLPEKYRIPIYLHYYEGYAVQEVAAILGQKPATVSTRLNRARAKLKTMLGGQRYEQTV